MFATISCEKDDNFPIDEKIPLELEQGFNGFIIDTSAYQTPNAFIEIWGVTTDSLSADYDISFTDGSFNYNLRSITDYNLMVYFDANSPELDKLSPGTYTIESTDERKPNNIVDAYIQIYNGDYVVKYYVYEGTVILSEQNGFYTIQYTLSVVINSKKVEVKGQYTGIYTIVDQRL